MKKILDLNFNEGDVISCIGIDNVKRTLIFLFMEKVYIETKEPGEASASLKEYFSYVFYSVLDKQKVVLFFLTERDLLVVHNEEKYFSLIKDSAHDRSVWQYQTNDLGGQIFSKNKLFNAVFSTFKKDTSEIKNNILSDYEESLNES